MSESNSCVNCGEEVIGKYCHYCGQKYGIVRLTWAAMFDDLQKRLFGFDNKYARTVRDLTLRPHKVIQTILDGIRVIYLGPVGFYFLMLTLYLLIASMLDIDIQEMMIATGESINGETQENTAGQQQFNDDLFSAMSNNFRIFSFLMVPFFVFGNRLLYRKSKMNLVEHSVVIFYSMGYPFLFSILLLVLYRFAGWNLGLYQVLPSVIFFAWVCSDFYSKNKVLGFLKGLLAYAIGYLFIMIVMFTIAIIYIVTSPEMIGSFASPNT
ncbi:MAG: DUF3667 domain-containing protein [Bacteroidota bacterium]